MTQEPNGPDEPMAAITPPGPGEARVWLELGEGGDPVAALEAALAVWKDGQTDVQGYLFEWIYHSIGQDGKETSWLMSVDANGNVTHTLVPNPPTPPYYYLNHRGQIVKWPP